MINNQKHFPSRKITAQLQNRELSKNGSQHFFKQEITISEMQRLEDTSTSTQVVGAIIAYSLCSSTLLLANKMAMTHLPLPSVVSFIQILSSAVIVLAIKYSGLQVVDDLDTDKLKAYALYIVAFVTCIFANMKALENSNVETVIVFRACSPIAVTVVEYFFMDRAWPTIRSTLSLLIVSGGAIIYCLSDSQIALEGLGAYGWVITYFFLITFEMTYGKKLTSSVKMDSVWGPVLYCNLLSIVPMGALGLLSGDFDNVGERLGEMSSTGWSLLVFSCIVGTLIGYYFCLNNFLNQSIFPLIGINLQIHWMAVQRHGERYNLHARRCRK